MAMRLTVAAVLDEAERQLDEFDPRPPAPGRTPPRR